MTTYYCKCGRQVQKSTKTATTGNRDTQGCEGCPYLLPWGPNVWTDSGYKMDVKGYECRMTDHPVDYTTNICSYGGPNDKTVLHIQSLDFDFLQTVTDWVRETFTGSELSGGFNREHMRAVEFFDGYRVGFYPAQNKKGVAAKQKMFRRFFHPDGTRLDMTPEEEKAKILADIEAGKAAASSYTDPAEGDCPFYRKHEESHFCELCGYLKRRHRTCVGVYKDDWHGCTVFKRYDGAKRLREELEGKQTMGKTYKCVKGGLAGTLYKIGPAEAGTDDRGPLTIKQLGVTPGSTWRNKSMAPEWGITNRRDAEEGLEEMAKQEGWQLATDEEIMFTMEGRPTLIGEEAPEDTDELTMAECDEIIRHIPEGYAYHERFKKIAAEAANKDDFTARMLAPEPKGFFFDRDFLGKDKRGADLSCRDGDDVLLLRRMTKYDYRTGRVPYPAVLAILWPLAQEMQQYAQAGLDPDDEDGTDLSKLRLSREALAVLDHNDIESIEDLAEMSDDEIRYLMGMTGSLFEEITEKLDAWANEPPVPDTNVGNSATAEKSSEAAMYRDDADRLYKIGVWEEGNSGDRYGILVSSDGEEWRHFGGSPVYGPEVDKPRELAQLKLNQLAKEHGMHKHAENPTPAAPASHADAGAAMDPARSAAGTVSLEGGPGCFDYSVLDPASSRILQDLTAHLYTARREYIIATASIVSKAHEVIMGTGELSELPDNSKYSNRGDETFRAWCQSVGISKSTAYQLLQVNALLAGATAEEVAHLDKASPSLLYAAAKPSAPAQLVQAVKDGDITTHKEYQDALARIKKLEAAAELDAKERDAAYAKANQYKAECDRRAQDQQRLEGLVTQSHLRIDEVTDKMAAEKESRVRAEHALKVAQEKAEHWEDKWNRDMPEMQRLIDEADAETEAAKKALAAASGPIETTVADPAEIEARAEALAAEKLAGLPSQLENAAKALLQAINAMWCSSKLPAYCIETARERDTCEALANALDDIFAAIDDMIDNYDRRPEGRKEDNNENQADWPDPARL